MWHTEPNQPYVRYWILRLLLHIELRHFITHHGACVTYDCRDVEAVAGTDYGAGNLNVAVRESRVAETVAEWQRGLTHVIPVQEERNTVDYG